VSRHLSHSKTYRAAVQEITVCEEDLDFLGAIGFPFRLSIPDTGVRIDGLPVREKRIIDRQLCPHGFLHVSPEGGGLVRHLCISG
jgi:hypothetical protein